MIEENNSFAEHPESRSLLHRVLRKSNHRITTDSALHPFVTRAFFTRLLCNYWLTPFFGGIIILIIGVSA
jgi:hypothetical protein